jgi:steroid 5-alpha reductase family enzyme
MADEEQGEAANPPPSAVKSFLRGVALNGFSAALLSACAYFLDLTTTVLIATGVQVAVYLVHALPFRSEKFYDLSGSATHLSVVFASLAVVPRVRTPRQLFCGVASVVWMTRLGTLLYLRISKDGKDGRFDHLKRNWFSFLGVWTLQASWVVLIQMPVVLVNTEDDTVPFLWPDYLIGAVWIFGFIMELEGDNQKMAFRSNPANRNKFITTGVWRYCRHPNYFGEITMWLALAAMVTRGAPDSPRLYWGWVSPAFTMVLLLKVSGVPMVEEAGKRKWGSDPEYIHYMKNTSCIVPWFPAKTRERAEAQNGNTPLTQDER